MSFICCTYNDKLSIEKIVTPVALPQDLAMVLQARDAFEVIPSLFKAKVN